MTCPCCGGLCDYYQWPCVRLTFANFVIDDDYEHDCKECEYLNSLSVVLKQTAGDPCVYTKTISCGSCIDNQNDIVFTFTATATTRTLTVYKLYALDLQASVAAVNTTDAVIFNPASFTVFSGCDPAGTATVQFAPCGGNPIAPCRGEVFNGATPALNRWPQFILLTPQNFVDVYQGTPAGEADYERDAACPVNDEGIFLGGFGAEGAAANGTAMDSNTSPAVLERMLYDCGGVVYRGASLLCDGDLYREVNWQLQITRCVPDRNKWILRIIYVPFFSRGNANGFGHHLECTGEDCFDSEVRFTTIAGEVFPGSCAKQNQLFPDDFDAADIQHTYISGDIDPLAGAGRLSSNCCPDELLNRTYPMAVYFFGLNPSQYDSGTHLLFQSNVGFGDYQLWLTDGGAGQIGVKLQVIE